MRRHVTVYLGLGSNMGNRRRNLYLAIERLSRFADIIEVSSIYDTEPVGNPDQRRFLNMVCQGRTGLPPLELLRAVKNIERKMGRKPGGVRNSPRPIDIDILLYGDGVFSAGELEIPHPRLAERAFVLVPLAEIAPDLVHPVSGKTITELAGGVGGKEGLIKLEDGVRCTGYQSRGTSMPRTPCGATGANAKTSTGTASG